MESPQTVKQSKKRARRGQRAESARMDPDRAYLAGSRVSQDGREDPPPRPQVTEFGYLSLIGKDPKKRYAWVNTNDLQTGVGAYRLLGYKPVITTSGGVRSAIMPEQECGEQIQIKECLLMEVSEERWRQIEYWGPDGKSGMARARAIQDQFFQNRPDGTRRARDQEVNLGTSALEGFRNMENL